MRLSKLTLDKMADTIEDRLSGTGHTYVLLTFNEAKDKCDFISTIPTDEALLLVASWVSGMMKGGVGSGGSSGGQASPSERGDH